MSEGGRPTRIETFLYDADGNRTEDERLAVRGEIVELDAEGRVLSRRPHNVLDWQVDPKSLEGDEGELATRPPHEESSPPFGSASRLELGLPARCPH